MMYRDLSACPLLANALMLHNQHIAHMQHVLPAALYLAPQLCLLQAHLWQSNSWQPAWGLAIVQAFHDCLTERDSDVCRASKNRTAPAQTGQHPFHKKHSKWRKQILHAEDNINRRHLLDRLQGMPDRKRLSRR